MQIKILVLLICRILKATNDRKTKTIIAVSVEIASHLSRICWMERKNYGSGQSCGRARFDKRRERGCGAGF
jgi:hypothetical protein